MPMPSLHPLVKATYQAYNELSKSRDASYLYMHYVFIRTISAFGYDNTNPEKIKILKDLAELELSGTVEEQNETLFLSVQGKLSLSQDFLRYSGPIFNPLRAIMMTCALLTWDCGKTWSIDSIEKHFVECNLSDNCEKLKTMGLDKEHLFFKELNNFIDGAKAYANELAVQNLLATGPVLQRMNTDLDLILQEQKQDSAGSDAAAQTAVSPKQKSIECQLRETANKQVQDEERQQNTEMRLKTNRQMKISPQINAWMHNKHANQNPKLDELVGIETRSLSDISRNLGFHNNKFSKGKNHYGHPFQPDHTKHRVTRRP